MKRITVDLEELMLAFSSSLMEGRYYLDTTTGQVLLITDAARGQREDLYDEYFDPDEPEAFVFEDLLAQTDSLRQWQKEQVRDVEFVETHFGTRVIAVPELPTYEAYNDMQDFISTIEDDSLSHQLMEATHGRGAFRRFRDILQRRPAELDRWYTFRDHRMRERVLEWLADNGIEPVADPERTDLDEAE
jgi:hypothetical protein